MTDDRDYFLKRALQEDEAARKASCVEARRRHEELAIAYRRRSLAIQPPASTATDGR